jgi:hypothetical protein
MRTVTKKKQFRKFIPVDIEGNSGGKENPLFGGDISCYVISIEHGS